MLFNSFEFLIFLPVVYGIFRNLRSQTHRLILFLVASCFFYSFLIPAYLLILFVLIGVDYWAGIRIEDTPHSGRKRLFLIASIAANLGILGFFKYTNFLIENLQAVAALFHWNLPLRALEIILPIGLSFHTFQSLSYVLEVHAGRFRAERSLLHYAVYVLYFPQLVAGPIERPQNILPQLHQKTGFDASEFKSGLKLILQGLFKKAVLADTLALVANRVFDRPLDFGAGATWAGVLAFTFQIYGDFSGYSDIARGVSRLFGIELMVNFNKPYFADSISDFWRRWHISLSTWFRDYVYIPLGGNRRGNARTQLHLIIVFLLSGLWHGANWTFIVWGALHGCYLLIENRVLIPLGYRSWPRILRRAQVFLLAALAWIFFRANTVSQALETLAGLGRSFALGFELLPRFEVQEATLAILMLLVLETLDEQKPVWARISELSWPVRGALYAVLVVLFLITAQFSGAQFIYFQF
jgi:alginate O-acetyltransferase complex protein AlgI